MSYARNRGLREAQAPLVAFIDDDERVNPGFLRAYLDFFDAHPEAVVAGGRIIAEYPTGRPDWMSKYVEMPIANPMDFGPDVRPFPAGRVPGGGNMAFRRAGLAGYGGFDPSLGRVNGELIGGEENDFFERLLAGGETIWYVPDAVMWHIIPPVEAHRGLFPAAELQCRRQPASPGADPPPVAEDLCAGAGQMGRDARAVPDDAAPQVGLVVTHAQRDQPGAVREIGN